MGQDEQETPPDVEAIIRQIKADVQASEMSVDPGIAEWAADDAELDKILAEANRSFIVGEAYPQGIKARIYRLLLRVMAPLVGEVNRFNTLSVRTLNRLATMLTGNDTGTQSDLLAQTRRRIDLLTNLGQRLDAYDALVLDARLQRLEQQLVDAPEKEAP